MSAKSSSKPTASGVVRQLRDEVIESIYKKCGPSEVPMIVEVKFEVFGQLEGECRCDLR